MLRGGGGETLNDLQMHRRGGLSSLFREHRLCKENFRCFCFLLWSFDIFIIINNETLVL